MNTLGADLVGRADQELDAFLVHFSSGCILESRDAQEVHTEDDTVNPLCFYSWTKVWAEHLLRDRMAHRGRGSLSPPTIRCLIARPQQLLILRREPAHNALVEDADLYAVH